MSKDTFARFAQYAYTSDYSVPQSNQRGKSTEKEEEVVGNRSTQTISGNMREGLLMKPYPGSSFDLEHAEEDHPEPTSRNVNMKDVFVGFYPSSKKTAKKIPIPQPSLLPRFPSDRFDTLSSSLYEPRNLYGLACETMEPFDANQSYSKEFLSHASLYILGDYQIIDSLKTLALHKLHGTLCIFQLNNKNFGDVIDLVSLAYTLESGGGQSDDGIGPLRSLVCRYIVTHIQRLSLLEEFLNLLEEGGPFVRDFVQMQLKWPS